jgi:hypothetical protein
MAAGKKHARDVFVPPLYLGVEFERGARKERVSLI